VILAVLAAEVLMEDAFSFPMEDEARSELLEAPSTNLDLEPLEHDQTHHGDMIVDVDSLLERDTRAQDDADDAADFSTSLNPSAFVRQLLPYSSSFYDSFFFLLKY